MVMNNLIFEESQPVFIYLISGGLFLIFYYAKLTTFINQEGIWIRFIPF
jgi:hypothetical protein